MTFTYRTRRMPPSWMASCVCRSFGLALIAALAILAFADAAEARSRRVRLSADLAAHLNSHATADVEVIVTGSSELVDRLARRHGLRVKKFLASGAVLSASRQALESLAEDGE